MITCPQCGAQNLPGMAYCENCGTPLPQQAPLPPGTGAIAAQPGPTAPGATAASEAPPVASVVTTPDPSSAELPQPVMPVDQLPSGPATYTAPPADAYAAPPADAYAAPPAGLPSTGANVIAAEPQTTAAPEVSQAAPPAAPTISAQPEAGATFAPAAPTSTPESPAAEAPAAPAPADMPIDVAAVVTPTPPPADQESVSVAPTVPATTAGVLTITFPSGQTYTMQGDQVDVGRADVAQNWHPPLDLIPYGGGAPDLGVSRHHARLVRQDGGFSVVDVGSTNGTYVNGQTAPYNQPVPLHDGDTLSFGAFNTQVSIQ